MNKRTKVAFCVPFLDKPTRPFLDAIEAAVPLIVAAGYDEVMVQERGCPYISHARSRMLRKALDEGAEIIVFLDYDLSFRPEDLLRLIQTKDDVVSGTYRFKKDEVAYMATIHTHPDGTPVAREDGCIRADWVPAGFLKVTKTAVEKFMSAYPELLYGDPTKYSVDLFNHGAYKGVWYGEDYAFSRRWNACGGKIWLIPHLQITHHSPDKAFYGCFHEFLLAQPGGSNYPLRVVA